MKKALLIIALMSLFTLGGCRTKANPSGLTFWNVVDIILMTDGDVRDKEEETDDE